MAWDSMFRAGDRVHHIGRGEDGTVLPSTKTGVVRVEFDSPPPIGRKSIGEFDEVWARSHHDWLQLTAPRQSCHAIDGENQ